MFYMLYTRNTILNSDPLKMKHNFGVMKGKKKKGTIKGNNNCKELMH